VLQSALHGPSAGLRQHTRRLLRRGDEEDSPRFRYSRTGGNDRSAHAHGCAHVLCSRGSVGKAGGQKCRTIGLAHVHGRRLQIHSPLPE